MSFSNVSAIILAGGNSERMSYPKAFLELKHETFIQKLINEYEKIIKEKEKIVVVLNQKAAMNNKWKDHLKLINNKCRKVINAFPEKGRLYSLNLGLAALPESTEYCYIQNIDNPFIDEQLLLQLYEGRKNDAYTAPVYRNKGGHPILISRKVIHAINKHDGDKNLREILSLFERKKIITDDQNILVNINTPEEYRMLLSEKPDKAYGKFL